MASFGILCLWEESCWRKWYICTFSFKAIKVVCERCIGVCLDECSFYVSQGVVGPHHHNKPIVVVFETLNCMYVGSPCEINRRLGQFMLIYFHIELVISITIVHDYHWMFVISYRPFISSTMLQLNINLLILNYVSFLLHTQNGHVFSCSHLS